MDALERRRNLHLFCLGIIFTPRSTINWEPMGVQTFALKCINYQIPTTSQTHTSFQPAAQANKTPVSESSVSDSQKRGIDGQSGAGPCSKPRWHGRVKRKADPHQENQWPCRMGRTGPRSKRVTLHRVAPVAIERTGNERHCLSLHLPRTLALTHTY